MQGYHYIVVNSSYTDRSITLRNTYALIGQLFLLLIMNTLGFGRNKKKCNTKYYITLPHIDKIRYIFFLIRNNLNEKEEGKIIYVKFFLSLKIYKKRNNYIKGPFTLCTGIQKYGLWYGIVALSPLA